MARSARLKRHFDELSDIGCLISCRPNPELHHCKGGSMLTIIGLMHGISSKPNDWLVIPLDHEFHQGECGIERGVESWERQFGTQIKLLDRIVVLTGTDVWDMAGLNRSAFGSPPILFGKHHWPIRGHS